jgi:hypothetical protein
LRALVDKILRRFSTKQIAEFNTGIHKYPLLILALMISNGLIGRKR